MSKPDQRPPVVFTDDGWMMNLPTLPSPEIIKETVVDPFEGLPASLWWSIGDHEVYHYETKIGEQLGEGYALSELPDALTNHNRPDWLINQITNLRHLMENHGGPVTVLSKLCRKAGLEFFTRVRMNSHYGILASDIGYGRFRRENPELLIGRPGEEIPAGTIDHDIRTGKDYAHPEVRDYMYAIITELFERFDVDGVSMDFCRHPAFFRREEAYQNRYLMTDLVQRIRERMNEVSKDRGRPIKLAVRVGPTIADSTRIGLDVKNWIDESLVDIVVAGKGSIPYEMPIGEFVEAAKDKKIQVYGCIEGMRPLIDDNALRGAAARNWRYGAGIYLYNYFTLPTAWKRRMLPQLADPARLAQLDKRYELDHADRILYGGHGGAFRNVVPAAQLPVVLHETLTENGPILRIDIADDLEAAKKEDTLTRCVLGLLFDNFTPMDELDLRLNDEPLPWASSRTSYLPWPDSSMTSFPSMGGKRSIQYDVGSPPLRFGINELEIRVRSSGPRGTDPPIVIGVEVTIQYRKD